MSAIESTDSVHTEDPESYRFEYKLHFVCNAKLYVFVEGQLNKKSFWHKLK